MLDLGGCSLHHISNTMERILKISFRTYSIFFRNHPTAVKDFKGHQILLDLEQHQILRYVETRWPSILPVAESLRAACSIKGIIQVFEF